MEFLKEILGQTDKAVAGRETDWDRRSGTVERDWMERAGDAIWGRDATSIGKSRRALEEKALKDSAAYSSLERKAGDALAGTDINLDIDYTMTEDDLKERLRGATSLLSNRELALGKNAPRDAVMNTTSLGELYTLGDTAAQQKAYDSPMQAGARSRQDWQDKLLMDDRREGRRNEAKRDQRSYDLRLDELDLRRQDQADKMDIYRQQVANQRADRKQQTMMALISGLATLGSGFAL